MKIRYLSTLATLLVLIFSSMALAANDPMRPPMSSASVKQAAPAWILSSVLISEDRHIAVINQSPVYEGGMINGAKVLKIYSDRVRLSTADKSFYIKLHPLSVKQPVRGQ